MKPLSVLYVNAILPPHVGGAAATGRAILSCFKGVFKERFKRIMVLTERGCDIKSIDPIEVHDVLFNYDSVDKHKKSVIKQLINYLIIIFFVVFTRNDIIHIHARYVYGRHIGKLVWLALLLSPSKVIIDIQDRFYNNHGTKHNFIVCSKELWNYYSWLSKKTYVPIPIEFTFLKGKYHTKHQIAYIGTITENKGVLELMEGYKQYIKKSPNPLELHLWGINNMADKIEKEVKFVKSMKYCGQLSNDDVFEKILEYKAVILPSKSEGMPRICLETMYCNRIIICHKSIRSLVPYISEQFILNDIIPESIENALFAVESYNKEISYDYDFTIHKPTNVSSQLINLYQQVMK